MSQGRRMPQWLPWMIALFLLTLLAILDRRDEEPEATPPAQEEFGRSQGDASAIVVWNGSDSQTSILLVAWMSKPGADARRAC